jgi:NADPH-dependent 2,4-dienoyl-CoA reductase/sulfur reductase-like enzyme
MAERLIAIVGGGLAGDTAAGELRAAGWTGRIVLICDERWRPYDRPPLSKGMLLGEAVDGCFLRPESWYAEEDIELIVGDAAVRIDAPGHQLELASGKSIAYTKLLLATGSRPKRLAHLDNAPVPVSYLRSIDDVSVIQPKLIPGARIVVVGGGVIGMEAAASAVEAGCSVTVLEGLDRVMARCVSAEVSSFIADYHRARGVEIICGARLAAEQTRKDAVLLEDGQAIGADLVLVGIGVHPNSELAEDAGLQVDDGIVVDRMTRTSDLDIYAAGDVARFESDEGPVRAEHWQHAIDQAVVAARVMVGEEAFYREAPWFWSDQFDLNIQVTGRPRGDERVLRGSFADAAFIEFHLERGAVVGAVAVNQGKWKRAVRKLIQAQAEIDPPTLVAPETNLKKLASSLEPDG